MANQLNMAQIHSILTLRSHRWSYRRIGREFGVHRDTVKRYVELAAEAGSGVSLPDLKASTTEPPARAYSENRPKPPAASRAPRRFSAGGVESPTRFGVPFVSVTTDDGAAPLAP